MLAGRACCGMAGSGAGSSRMMREARVRVRPAAVVCAGISITRTPSSLSKRSSAFITAFATLTAVRFVPDWGVTA